MTWDTRFGLSRGGVQVPRHPVQTEHQRFGIKKFKDLFPQVPICGTKSSGSGGFAFVLQIYAQKNISPAPAAIIFSLEGVFATIAAWFLLNQVLGINNLLGCFFILCGVLLSQLLPLIKRST